MPEAPANPVTEERTPKHKLRFRINRFLNPLPFFVLAGAMTLQAQQIVAHRGASHDAPENTLAAFRLAWEQGADAIEGDFHLTADGRIICHHDANTKKLTGRELVVSRTHSSRLRGLDAGSHKGARWKGERMPFLEEVLATVPAGKRIFIEIKCGPEMVPVLEKELAQSSLEPAQTVFIAFDEKVIAACKKAFPDRKAFWLTSFKQNQVTRRWSPTPAAVFETLERCKADGLDCKAERRYVNKRFTAALRKLGREFHCWTVNDPETARHFAKLGVDSITTDRPAFLRSALAQPTGSTTPGRQ